MILETERLTLTPFAEDDGPALYPLMSDAEVMANLEAHGVEDPDEVNAVVAGQVRAMAAGEAAYWAIRLDGRVIGWVQLADIDRRRRQAELAVLLLRDAHGQGFRREALTAVINHAAVQRFRRLTVRTKVGGLESDALLANLGFTQLGYARGHIDRDGERRDWRLWEVWL